MLHRYFYQFCGALLLCVMAHSSYGQTTLSPGDIVIVGVNSSPVPNDPNDADSFSFAPLVDLAANTQIQFTDNGWQKTTNSFRATEGTITYTAPASGVQRGQIITYTTKTHPDFSTSAMFRLAVAGDQILAYQTTASGPRFICGLSTIKGWSDAISSNTSALPTDLQASSAAVAVAWCNAYMSQATLRRGLTVTVRTSFTTAANWSGNTSNQGRVVWPLTRLILEGLVADDDELQALQALYTSTTGPNWTNHTNWPTTLPWATTLSNLDFETWYGLMVSNGDVTSLNLDRNQLTGNIPADVVKLAALQEIRLYNNNLSGSLPQGLALLPLKWFAVSFNHFTSIPDFSGMSPTKLAGLSLYASGNDICFGPLEANFNAATGQKLPATYNWSNQNMPASEETETQNLGEPITFTCSFSGTHNVYQWGKGAGNAWTAITGATAATYRINRPVAGDAGQYRCKVTNTVVTNLELQSPPINLVLRPAGAAAYSPPNAPAADLDRNWTIERTYDGTGEAASNVLAETKQFTDGLGRATQAQARSRANSHVFASETIYDSAGQPVVQTLAAPIDNQGFAYKEKFAAVTDVTGTKREYGPGNFEDGHAANPDALDVTDLGTLGYYYSTDNQLEPYTPATNYPFSLTQPAKGPLGGLVQAGGPGETFRVGGGHEVKGREIPLLKEFDHYVSLRHHFVASNYLVTLQRQGTKTVSVDADGRESVVVTNKEGQALVSCLTGPQYQPTVVYGFISTAPLPEYDASAPKFLDIHIPATGEHELKFTLSGQVRVINLNGSQGVRLAGTTTYLDSADVEVNPGIPRTKISTTATSVYLLPGFYRLVSLKTTSLDDANQWFTYNAEYGNFSYTYYDDAGRAVATVAPNGLDNRNTTAMTGGGTAGLAGAWDFNEGTGTTVRDNTDNGLTGTINGTPGWSTAAAAAGIPPSPAGGSCLAFDGTSYVRVGDVPALRMSGTLSFEAWIYPTGNQSGIVLNKESEYELALLPDGQLYCAFWRSTPTQPSIPWQWEPTGIVPTLNAWSHVALTYDNGLITTYLNGGQVSQRMLGAGTIKLNGGEFWIGDRQATGARFYGAIDGVRVWNTVHPPAPAAVLPTAATVPQFVTRNTYDSSSRLLASESTDEGRSEYVYARDGRIRFSQSALQRSAGRFSYSNYDEVGRVVESGEYTPANAQDMQFQNQLPQSFLREAEGGVISGGSVSNYYSGAHGEFFVGNLDTNGSAVQFSLPAMPAAGNYVVNLRYAAQFNSTRTMTVYANNVKVQQVFFPSTGSWSVWDVATITLPLQVSSNTISVRYDTGDNGAINLDYLEVMAEQAVSSTSVLNLLEERMPTNSLLAASCRQRSFVTYDQVFTGNGPQKELLLAGRTQEFTNGAVTKTQNDQVTTWYSYDEQGRVTWMVQSIAGVGTKTLDYTYDLAGNVLEVAYQQGQPDAFHHYYEYDDAQRLYKVYTSSDGTVRTLQAKYFYYLHGPLKRVELANGLQGVDYTYTLQGWLKSINHVNGRRDPGGDSPAHNGLAKDLFGLTLDYFSGDYQSGAQPVLDLAASSTTANQYRYDGTIRTASWRAGSAAAHQSVYDYDAKSQLNQSKFGTLAVAGPATTSTYQVTPGLTYQEGGLRYDPNGNMQGLRRTDQNGATTDNFSYEYTAGTNRLAAVHSGGSPTGTAVLDYDYDAVGQMTRQRDEAGDRYYTYDVTGKTTGVYLDAARTQAVVEFVYDDRGFRVRKKSYGTGANAGQVSTTYYVRDAGGNLVSLYEQGPQTGNRLQRNEVPIYGASRLGVLTHLDDGTATGTDDTRYELNDHLGDARVVFHRPTTVAMETSAESATAQQDIQWEGLGQARHYTANGARTGVQVIYVPATTLGGRIESVQRTVSVLRGDTISFSAWTRVFAVGQPLPRPTGLRVLPMLTFGRGPAATDNTPGVAAHPGLLNQLSAGLVLTGWGSKAAPAGKTLSTAQVWIRYRVLNESGTQVAEHYEYYSNTTQNLWVQLQTGVRVAQAGSVEVTIGSDDPAWQAYFDDLRLEQTGGMIVQEQHQYAYGSPLVGLNYAVGNKLYRYGYQGQYAEKDAETGFESFELRLYNDRIGRWTSNDPYGQHNSPFTGMGNNPISRTDSNGGIDSQLIGSLIGFGIGAGIGTVVGINSGNPDGWWVGGLSGGAFGIIAGGFAGYLADVKDVKFDKAGTAFINGVKISRQVFTGDFTELPRDYPNEVPLPGAKGMYISLEGNKTANWAQSVTTDNLENLNNVPEQTMIDSKGTGNMYDRRVNEAFNDGYDSRSPYGRGKSMVDIPLRKADQIKSSYYWQAETSKVVNTPNGNRAVWTISYGYTYDIVNDRVELTNVRFHRFHRNLSGPHKSNISKLIIR